MTFFKSLSKIEDALGFYAKKIQNLCFIVR